MFIEIKRINRNGEELDNLVNIEGINNIIELTQEDTNLYDSEGNLVKTEKPTERLFLVLTRGGTNLKVNEDTYKKLKKLLVK